ncbi:MAG: chemotaxis protein, partial [Firmicutes bacterium HGW-Firmicutes-15]
DYTEFTRIIVSDINNKKIGIIVDEVMEVLRIPGKLVEESPDILTGNQAQSFMNGIANLGNRMIMMLNLENILVEKEWQKIADIGKTDEIPAKKAPKLKKRGRED